MGILAHVRRLWTFLLLAVCVFFLLSVVDARSAHPQPTNSSQPEFHDFNKEALTAVKDLTTNLLFLATGVFALVGSYFASRESTPAFAGRDRRKALLFCFVCFAISMVAGLFVIMALIDQLQNLEFDLNAPFIRFSSLVQIVAVAVGAAGFLRFLWLNILPRQNQHK